MLFVVYVFSKGKRENQRKTPTKNIRFLFPGISNVWVRAGASSPGGGRARRRGELSCHDPDDDGQQQRRQQQRHVPKPHGPSTNISINISRNPRTVIPLRPRRRRKLFLPPLLLLLLLRLLLAGEQRVRQPGRRIRSRFCPGHKRPGQGRSHTQPWWRKRGSRKLGLERELE